MWVGSPIRDLAFADGTAYVLTSDRVRGGAVSLIDMSTNRITDTIELGIGAPTQMTLSPTRLAPTSSTTTTSRCCAR